MSATTRREPSRNVLTTAALIGSLALLLAAGLHRLGLLAQADALVATRLREALQATSFAKTLPDGSLWLATAGVAYSLALVMLAVPTTWQRVVVWVSLLLLVAGWAPVLALASHEPTIAAPFVAGLWAGICALIYARSHPVPDGRPRPDPA